MGIKVILYLLILVFSNRLTISADPGQFRNPITDPIPETINPAPIVFHLNSYYYLLQRENNYRDLVLLQSPILTDFRNATRKVIYSSTLNPGYVHPGSMHIIGFELYVYFSIYSTSPNTYKLNGMRVQNSSDPMGEWDAPVQMLPNDWNVLSGTVMRHGGYTYFVWDRENIMEFPNGYDIYIDSMITPTTLSGWRVRLRRPKENWECYMNSRYFCQNRSPAFIYRNNTSYLVISAGQLNARGYCLTMMSIPFDKEPLYVRDWEDVGMPIFGSDDTEQVFGPGGASFVESPDKTETWMVYTAKDVPDLNDGFRTARLERIDWDETGTPQFPRPHGCNSSQPVPSG